MNLMKKLPVALCLIIAFGSCKVDDPKPLASVSYNIDGVNMVSTWTDCLAINGLVSVFGDKGKEALSIFIDTTITEGATYHIGNLQTSVGVEYVNWSNSRQFDSDNGTLVIEHYDGNEISGIFNATVVNGPTTKTITNGKFDAIIDYSSYSDSTYYGTLNTFRKKNILLHLNK